MTLEDTDKEVLRWMARRKDWVSAKELAKAHKADWRRVCRSLKRLSRQGEVEEDTREWYDQERRLRECSTYRKPSRMASLMPTWAVPRVLPHNVDSSVVRVVSRLD